MSWNKIKACAESDEATNLMVQYGKRTEESNVRFVPHILFNDVYNETVSDKARDSFVQVVCGLFTEKPTGC